MKTMKILTALIIALMILTTTATADIMNNKYYSLLTIVTSWERVGESDLYIVNCTDKTGNVWSFLEDGNVWKIGDLANLLMTNMSTEHEEDDEIVTVTYEGHLTPTVTAEWLTYNQR